MLRHGCMKRTSTRAAPAAPQPPSASRLELCRAWAQWAACTVGHSGATGAVSRISNTQLSLNFVKTMNAAQPRLTLCDPTDYTVHGILQDRTLECVAFPLSRGSSQPRDWTQVSHIEGRLPAESRGKPKNTGVGSLSLLQQIFLTQELNWGLLHCRQILYQLSCHGRPNMRESDRGRCEITTVWL